MLDHLIISLDAGAESSLQSQIQQSVVEAILPKRQAIPAMKAQARASTGGTRLSAPVPIFARFASR
jgi:hypothetical protein